MSQTETSAPVLSAVDRALGRVEAFLDLIAGLFIFGLMLIGIVQVLGRQIFNLPMVGYVDLVELSMATFAFLGASYCQRMGGHVRMELFLARMPKRWQWITEAFNTLPALFIVGVLVIYGWDHTVRAYELGDSTIDAEYPVWPSKLLVPVAFSVLWLRLLVQQIAFLRLSVRPDAEPVAIPLIETIEQQAEHEIHETFGEVDEESHV